MVLLNTVAANSLLFQWFFGLFMFEKCGIVMEMMRMELWAAFTHLSLIGVIWCWLKVTDA